MSSDGPLEHLGRRLDTSNTTSPSAQQAQGSITAATLSNADHHGAYNAAGNRNLSPPARDDNLVALDTRQAAFVARRFRVRPEIAAIVAGYVFGGAQR